MKLKTEPAALLEPFKVKMIEPLSKLSYEERVSRIRAAHYNLFGLDAADVRFDFLTDSGMTAMSARQWGALMTADESYAGSRSFRKFEAAVQTLTGYPHVIPVHQGRAAEKILTAALVKEGDVIPSNNHFESTRAHLEKAGARAIDLVIDAAQDPALDHPFKGSIDLKKLEAFCNDHRGSIPFALLTITNNSGGGQPVSLENIQGASQILKRHGVPLVLDACRFAENSHLIRLRESACAQLSTREIARKTFDLADGCYVSAKKDGLANMGGFIALKRDTWVTSLKAHLVMMEGFPTYGGLAARDLEAIAIGLEEVLDEDYLSYRVELARFFSKGLNAMGIPTVQPSGVHAIFIDAGAFLPKLSKDRHPAQSLSVAMYESLGIRSLEVGSVTLAHAPLELVRLALPRRVYLQSHFNYILEGLKELVSRKDEIRGLKLVSVPEIYRNLGARLEKL